MAKGALQSRMVAKLGSVVIAASASPAFAEGLALTDLIPEQSIANSGFMLIVFVGAFAFAMWSATWLIRERRQLAQNNRAAALELADLRARHERAQALLDVPDQRVVIWEGGEKAPVCRGKLPTNTGAPFEPAEFIGFGTWMTSQSAQSFERAVKRLRERAEAFDLSVDTKAGSVIEVQGRASGSHAFVRFLSLSGDRAALAALESEHTRMMQMTDTMRALLDALPYPAWLRDGTGKLTWVNPAYTAAVDANSFETVCNENLGLLDASARQQVAAHHDRLRKLETVSHYRDRIPITAAGDRRTMDVSEVALDSGYAGLAVDMSEIEKVQSNLRRTLESHAQTMNQLATAVAIFDEKRHLVFFNQAFESLWELDPKFLDGEPENGRLFDALRDGGKIAEQPDWSKWRNSLLKVYEATQPQEHWWHLPDNRTLRVVANPQKQGGVTWVFENITEQLEMESRYIAMTQVQGETLDNLNEAIAVFAANGRLKLSNPSFQKLWSLEDEQVAAETPITALFAECRATIEDPAIVDGLITGVTGVSDARTNQTGRMALKSGKMLDYALVPLPNGQTLLSFADVSASVNLELTLKERNEALLAAEKLKNAFIERVSYEFRAPLTNIKGFAEVLDQQVFGPLNPKQKEYVKDITTSSKVLHSLVDNLLDLATVDAGIMELDLETMDLRNAMRSAATSVTDLLKARNIRLTLKQSRQTEGTGSFVADPKRVHQILFNLLSNAIGFSPKGSEITLESAVEEDNVILRVIDSGPGIPDDQRPVIFDRFSPMAKTGGRRGAGLGLSISESLAKLHGGEVVLESSSPNGSSFLCRLPKFPKTDTTPVREAAQ